MAERLLFCPVPCGGWKHHDRIPGTDHEYACQGCGAARILPGAIQRRPERGPHSLRRPLTTDEAWRAMAHDLGGALSDLAMAASR